MPAAAPPFGRNCRGRVVILALAAALLSPVPDAARAEVLLNQQVVNDLARRIDLSDPLAVFGFVFRRLPPEVTVYPTENYFYWRFHASGREIWGNFRLDVADRDRGVLHLGYFEYDASGRRARTKGWLRDLTAKDGVRLERVDAWVYSVTYRGRTVLFRLHDSGWSPPGPARLRPEEAYVGPVFDESGVRFHLLFNKTAKHFYYMLDERHPAPEAYDPSGKHRVIGQRTGFAYYLDRRLKRKILIGVHALNVRRNNYYDGPFDQLPDNYVDRSRIATWLVQAFPDLRGKINRYGQLLDGSGDRVAISSYYVYRHEHELRFVESCLKTRQSRPRFYACITPDLP